MTDMLTRRFNPGQLRDPHSGEWTDGPGGALKDTLKLAGKIDLKPGETFGGSAKASDNSGDFTAVFARIDTPGGMKIRFGTVLPEDARKWRAANRGRTVELSETNVRQLQDVLDGSPQAGRDSVKQYYADVRAAHAADLKPDDYPDPEIVIVEGAIRAGWGDVHWKLQRDADTGPELPGIRAPGAGWSLGLDIVPAGTDPGDGDSMYVDSVDRVKALAKALDSLAKGQARARSTYGTVAITADPWINERAQRILNRGLPALPPRPSVGLRRFNPAERRDPRGRWATLGGVDLPDVGNLFDMGNGSYEQKYHVLDESNVAGFSAISMLNGDTQFAFDIEDHRYVLADTDPDGMRNLADTIDRMVESHGEVQGGEADEHGLIDHETWEDTVDVGYDVAGDFRITMQDGGTVPLPEISPDDAAELADALRHQADAADEGA